MAHHYDERYQENSLCSHCRIRASDKIICKQMIENAARHQGLAWLEQTLQRVTRQLSNEKEVEAKRQRQIKIAQKEVKTERQRQIKIAQLMDKVTEGERAKRELEKLAK